MTGKLLAYHLKSPRVPQFENHCSKALKIMRKQELCELFGKIIFGGIASIFRGFFAPLLCSFLSNNFRSTFQPEFDIKLVSTLFIALLKNYLKGFTINTPINLFSNFLFCISHSWYGSNDTAACPTIQFRTPIQEKSLISKPKQPKPRTLLIIYLTS